jgi:recombination protein RecR
VPIFDEAPEQKIRQKELMERLTQMTSQEEGHKLKEVILATSVNPEGEHTASYIAGLLKPLINAHGFRVSTLGRGLSTGTELEYSDSETLKSALQNRR